MRQIFIIKTTGFALIAALLCALLLPWHVQAWASSDIGYILNRGKTTLIVRFGLYSCDDEKDQKWGTATYRELERTDKAFFELAHWLLNNNCAG